MSWVAVAMAAVGTATAVAKGVKKKKLANEQMDRSEDLRTEAYGVKKPALRPEFQSALQASKLRTLYGLPNSGSMKDEIDLELATNLGRGKASASSGGELLQYASSLGAEGSRLKRDINLTDATMRDKNFGGYMNTLWNVGNEELKNVARQERERNKLLGQAGALEDASTANDFQGTDEIIGAVGTGVSSAMGAYSASKMAGAAGKTGNSATPASLYQDASQIAQQQIAPKTTLAPVIDSRTLMDNGLTDADMVEIKAIMAQRPDLELDEIIQIYKNTRKF